MGFWGLEHLLSLLVIQSIISECEYNTLLATIFHIAFLGCAASLLRRIYPLSTVFL